VTEQSDQVNVAGDPVKILSDPVNGTNTANRTIGIAIAAIVLVFGVFTVALWRAGFFTFTGTESSSKVVAQALTFVGGLVGAVVSILGILLKYSIDRQAEARLAVESRRSAAVQDRAERRLQMDSERSAALQREAEKRLKLEAATKVIQLFVTSDGKDAPSTQIAGGLLTLSSLGQHSLAILLTADLLRREMIGGSTACEVIEQALQQDSEDIQREAICLMMNYPKQMLTENGMAAPDSISNWNTRLCEYVREWAPIVLADIMTKRPLAEWRSKYGGVARAVLAILALGWRYEKEDRIRSDIGVTLNSLLRAFPDCPSQVFHQKETIDMDKIRAEVVKAQPGTDAGADIVTRLDKWIADANAPVPPSQPA
jgi:hypothetical protein